MKLGGEDRSQSVQIGAIILFGFLVISFTTYQTTVVPYQNSQIEFKHEQVVRNDMVALDNSIVTTGTTGNAAPAEIKLGTRFPSRALFVNPPPAVGRLQTVDPPQGNVTINLSSEATFVGQPVNDEARDFWARNTWRNYTTKHVVYTPQYREYSRSSENISIQGSNTFARYESGESIILTPSSRLIKSDKITILLIKGEVEESGVGAASISPEEISHITRREEINGTLNITIPTSLSPAELQPRLTAPPSASVTVSENTTTGGVDVSVRGRFHIGIAAVNIGSSESSEPGPAYIDFASIQPSQNVKKGTTAKIEMEVRDRYGNPLSGILISANSSAGQSPFVDTDINTSSDGTATFQYNTSKLSLQSMKTHKLNFSYAHSSSELVPSRGYNERSPENATMSLTISQGLTSSGGSSSTSGSWPLSWTDPSSISANSDVIISGPACDTSVCTVNGSVVLQISTNGKTNGATVSYDVNNSSRALVNESSPVQTGDSGFDTVSLIPNKRGSPNGTVTVSASSGGGVATRTITFQNVGPLAVDPLITAIQPDPDELDDNKGEFIRLIIPKKYNTNGWKLKDSDKTEKIKTDISGVVYFTRNKKKFTNQWEGVALSQTFKMGLRLNNGGENITLINSSGVVVDQVAYGSNTFADGSSLDSPEAGEVAKRITYANGSYQDTDNASDWTTESACKFFEGGNGCPTAAISPTGTASITGGPRRSKSRNK